MKEERYEEAVERIKGYLPDFNPYHKGLIETVIMLLDELDESKQYIIALEERVNKFFD